MVVDINPVAVCLAATPPREFLQEHAQAVGAAPHRHRQVGGCKLALSTINTAPRLEMTYFY